MSTLFQARARFSRMNQSWSHLLPMPEHLRQIDELDGFIRNALFLAPGPPGLRLTVTLDPPQAVLDGAPYALANEQCAIYLQALLEARGDWMGPNDITVEYPLFTERHIDRIYKKLPKPIQDLIELKPAKGSRIRVEQPGLIKPDFG